MNKGWEEIKGKTPQEILNEYYYPKSQFISTIVVEDIIKELGINISDMNFTKIKRNKAFKQKIKEKGNLLCVMAISSYGPIIVYNKEYNNLGEKIYAEFDESNLLKYRQRESLAKCIGYLASESELVEDTFYVECVNSMAYNKFMEELLVPYDKLLEAISILGDILSIKALAFEFGVTAKTMKRIIRRLETEGKLQGKILE